MLEGLLECHAPELGENPQFCIPLGDGFTGGKLELGDQSESIPVEELLGARGDGDHLAEEGDVQRRASLEDGDGDFTVYTSEGLGDTSISTGLTTTHPRLPGFAKQYASMTSVH